MLKSHFSFALDSTSKSCTSSFLDDDFATQITKVPLTRNDDQSSFLSREIILRNLRIAPYARVFVIALPIQKGAIEGMSIYNCVSAVTTTRRIELILERDFYSKISFKLLAL